MHPHSRNDRLRLWISRRASEGIRGGVAGFSLVELMIVLALMCIMSVMLYGFGSKSHQRQQQELCRQNLQKLYVAMQIYANDFHGAFPATTNAVTSEDVLGGLVPKYTADVTIFTCPGGRDSELRNDRPLTAQKISYAYYMGLTVSNAATALMSDRQVNTNSKGAGDQAFSLNGKGPGNNHHKYGGNVLFCDGHCDQTPSRLSFALPVPAGAVLLNPKP